MAARLYVIPSVVKHGSKVVRGFPRDRMRKQGGLAGANTTKTRLDKHTTLPLFFSKTKANNPSPASGSGNQRN